MRDYDVVIVGGGPAGLGVADYLSKHSNLSLLVIEKGREPDKRTCIVQSGLSCPPQSCGPCNIMTGVGGAGGMSDGKLLLSPYIGGDLTEFGLTEAQAYKLIEQIDEEMIGDHLSTMGIADPDLIIRTAGEQRLSNFLLWQAAYSELYFCPKYWPDFDGLDLEAAVSAFSSRTRRFGALPDTAGIVR